MLAALNMPVRPLSANARLALAAIGQSQLWGTGSLLGQAVNPQWGDTTSYGRIWDKIGKPTAIERVDDGVWAPLTTGFARTGEGDAMGPELQVAYRLRQIYQRPVDIVKCCLGGADLHPDGAPANWHPSTTGEGSMWELFRDYYWGPALADAVDEFGLQNIHLVGVVWQQGEADSGAGIPTSGAEYAGHLVELLTAIRNLMGQNTAVAVGRVANFHESQDPDVLANFPQVQQVRAAQVAVANADPLARWFDVDTKIRGPFTAFPLGSDNVHGNGQWQQQSGSAMTGALLKLDSLVAGPGGASDGSGTGNKNLPPLFTAANTGPRIPLMDWIGPNTITQPGTYQGFKFTGTVTIASSDVELLDFEIDGEDAQYCIHHQNTGNTGFRAEYGHVHHASRLIFAHEGHYTHLNCEFAIDAFRMDGDVAPVYIGQSYVHNLGYLPYAANPDEPPHSDGAQIRRRGAPITFDQINWDMWDIDTSTFDPAINILIQGGDGPVDGKIIIRENWFGVDGNYQLQLTAKDFPAPSDVELIRNVFRTGQWTSLPLNSEVAAEDIVFDGNTDENEVNRDAELAAGVGW